MDNLWKVIAELGAELHPDRIDIAATKVETLCSADSFSLAIKSFGPNADRNLLKRLEEAWQQTKKTTPGELASALRSASATSTLFESRSSIELVWTGESTGIVPVRHTEQVLCEVIRSAQHRLFMMSFVAYEVKSIQTELEVASERGVRIDILMEQSQKQGGRSTANSLEMMRQSVPKANLYYRAGKENTHSEGVVHGKCAVADGITAFITSANLTSAAMERNMEVGILIRGGNLPNELHRHLEALIMTGIVQK